MKLLVAAAIAFAGLVTGVVFLWPAPAVGPEPIAYGRDTCASCRMHVSRPGFAAELRDRDGTLTKYDDLGCLVKAILAGRGESEAAWVEDHASGHFLALRRAHLVGADPATTPMGSGLVAFADAATARAYADANGARVMGFEDVVRDTVLLARLTPPPANDGETAP